MKKIKGTLKKIHEKNVFFQKNRVKEKNNKKRTDIY